MARDRYHYDSRGGLKGFSSDQSPLQRGCAKLLLWIGLPILLIVTWMAGNNDDQETQNASEAATDASIDDDAYSPLYDAPSITAPEGENQESAVADTNAQSDSYGQNSSEMSAATDVDTDDKGKSVSN